jgi:hypothetical protein
LGKNSGVLNPFKMRQYHLTAFSVQEIPANGHEYYANVKVGAGAGAGRLKKEANETLTVCKRLKLAAIPEWRKNSQLTA